MKTLKEEPCGCTKTKYCTKHFNESVHKSHPEKTLAEEREAIVEILRPKVTIRPEDAVRWGGAQHILQEALDAWYKDFAPALDSALLSHEEKVMERVMVELRMEIEEMIERGGWSNGQIEQLQDLTLPITDENV